MTTHMMPSAGAHVLTADGKELGTVKEIAGECFKLDVPLQPDYWLATDTIESSNGDRVYLRYLKDNLKTVQHEGTDHKGLHPHL